MKLNEESSDFVYLGKRIDKALDYIQNNKTDLLDWFNQYVEIPYQDIMSGELELEEEDYTFDYLDSLLDDLETKFNIILKNQTKMNKETLRLQMLSGIITESEYKAKLEESLWDRIKNIPKAWLSKIKGGFPAIMVKALEDAGIKVGKPFYFYDRRYNDSNSTREGEWVLSKSTLKSVDYKTGNNNIEVEVSRDGGKTWKLDDVESLRIKLDLESDLSKLQTMDEKQLQAWYEKMVAATKKQFELKNVASNPKDLKKPQSIGESLNENFVGMGMVGNIFDREKTDYEIAFEHFSKGTSLNEDMEEDLEESSPYEGKVNENVDDFISSFEFSQEGNDEKIDFANRLLDGNISDEDLKKLKSFFSNELEFFQFLIDPNKGVKSIAARIYDLLKKGTASDGSLETFSTNPDTLKTLKTKLGK